MQTTLTRPTTAAAASDTGFFGHPGGLSTLFFSELWERFSYYGMRAILILFMTAAAAQGGLGFSTRKAGLIYGTYTSLVYLMSLPGGWLADRFLGLRKAVLTGGILIMCGHICLAMPSLGGFYAGLAFVILGTGLLKPNISALVGELYGADDARRDAGFSIYYMGINLGAFLAPLAVGWLAQGESFKAMLGRMGITPEASWHFGFGAAAVGMACGLTWYVAGWKRLGNAGLRPASAGDPASSKRDKRMLLAGAGVAAAIVAFGALAALGIIPVTVAALGGAFGWILALTPVCLFPALFFFGGFDKAEKRRLLVIMVLFFGAAAFWSVFEQAGSTLTLFADRNTETVIGLPFALFFATVLAIPALLAWRWSRGQAGSLPAVGFATVVTLACAGAGAYLLSHRGQAFPSSFFQSANALFIVALAPAFAALWVQLGSRQPSSPAKFAIGLLFAGLGFAILVPIASATGRVSPLWLTATYMLHTIGELCLSPVGLSAMGRLAPRRIMGLVLGIWFLASSLGNFMAGFAAGFYENMPLGRLFAVVALVAILATAIMAATVKPIRAMLARD